MTDWAITLPKSQDWDEYSDELYAAAKGAVLNYRVPHQVKVMKDDRVFIVWRGAVRGWNRALGCTHLPNGLTCETTGRAWGPGWYVQRTGLFMPVAGPEMQGFRGIRRVNFKESSWTTTATPAAATPEPSPKC